MGKGANGGNCHNDRPGCLGYRENDSEGRDDGGTSQNGKPSRNVGVENK